LEILFRRKKEQLTYGSKTIWAWNKIRNLENGLRGMTEVVFTEPANRAEDAKPFSPQLFPVGKWSVGRPVAKKDAPYLEPFFIPTNAVRTVPTWTVNAGHYIEQKGEQLDSGYGLHYSTSTSTLGCIRISLRTDLIDLVNAIRAALDRGEAVSLTVED
jgi:hypothetical protein